MAALRCLIQAHDQVFIILDALDECKERRELLQEIEQITGWKTGKLYLLATSRHENDIEESLGVLLEEEGRICIQSALVDDDIREYIHERIHTDPGLKRWRNHPHVQQEIEASLMGKAAGM